MQTIGDQTWYRTLLWPADEVASRYAESAENSNWMCSIGAADIPSLNAKVDTYNGGGTILYARQPVIAPVEDSDGNGIIDQRDDVIAIVLTGNYRRGGVKAMRLNDNAFLWSNQQRTPNFDVIPALADLKSNGEVTYLFLDNTNHIVALDSSGQFKWQSDVPVATYVSRGNRIILSDLTGSGELNIIVGPSVYNSEGKLLWAFDNFRYKPYSTVTANSVPYVTDLNNDGRSEIAFYNQVRDADGNLLWETPFINTSVYSSRFTSADLNNDGSDELIVSEYAVGFNRIYAVSYTGELILEYIDRNILTESANIISGDFDGDGQTEIFHPAAMLLLDNNGTIIWQNNSLKDEINSLTEAIAADINGDGKVEFIFTSGRNSLYIVSAETGLVLSKTYHDIGANADLQVPALLKPFDNESTGIYMAGNDGVIRFSSSNSHQWFATNTTNNHADQRMGEFNAASQFIGSSNEVKFQQYPGTSVDNRSFKGDFKISSPQGLTNNEQSIDVSLSLQNIGMNLIAAGSRVEIYKDEVTPPNLLTSQTVAAFNPHDSIDLTFNLDLNTLGQTLIARVVPVDALLECEAGNNVASSELVQIEVSDIDGATGLQTLIMGVKENRPAPAFITTTLPDAQVDQAYLFEFEATASSAVDTVFYTLLNTPVGMTIDTYSGVINWLPLAEQFNVQSITVIARTISNRVAETSFAINVLPRANNSAPIITSSPVDNAFTGRQWQYRIVASDADGDSIKFSLISAPNEMTINVRTGLINWTSSMANQVSVTVRAEDGLGAFDEQVFSLNAIEDPNSAPVITSSPFTQAQAEVGYSYQVEATDADGDALTYELVGKPVGMSINDAGLINWAPAVTRIGEIISFTIIVEDSVSKIATQEVTLEVVEFINYPPVILSTPVQYAYADELYAYQIEAIDINGDVLTYSLITAPVNVSLDAQGLLRWTPLTTDVAIYTIQVSVSDGRGAATQTFGLQVLPVALPLELEVFVNPALAEPNELINISLITENGHGPITRRLVIDGVDIPVSDITGIATFTSDQSGAHNYVATVIDDIDELTVTGEFYVKDLTDNDAPVVSISNITNLEIITAPKQVMGSVNDVNLKDWRLYLHEKGRPVDEVIVLGTGTSNIANQVLGTFDPTMLQNGQFEIILEATDINNYSSTALAVVSVDGDFKVGNFSITFEDVNIPVAGMPIVVTRTYDSRQRHKDLDFGYSWSVDYQNMRIHESRKIGLSWRVDEYPILGGSLFNYCLEPNGNPIVSITLPDGRVEKLNALANPHCQQLVAVTDVNIEFEALEGTTSTLTQSSYSQVRLVNGNLVDLLDQGNDVDPSLYQLTTVDGYVFELNEGFTITRITTPTGYSLTYTEQGITHSGGKGVTFERDVTSNRITAITLPDGNVVRYEYNAQGNLVKHIDVLNQETTFTYESTPTQAHLLLDILDANGNNVARNEYDDTGRLVAQIDGDGNRIEFTHDIDARQEIIRNRRGFTQVFTYDEKGNVITQTNALGETVTRSYDAQQNVLSETDHLGHANAWTYDLKRNKLTETNALGYVTTNAYNSLNKLLTERDDDDNILITNTYLSTGDIDQSTNTLGQVTTFAYDAVSRQVSGISDELGAIAQVTYGADYPNSVTDSSGVVTTQVNDDMGNKLSETTTRTVSGSQQSLITRYEYDDKNRLTKITDAQGNITQSEYDIFDREIARIDALQRRTEIDYDIRGNQIATRYPDGTSEISEYDAENNLTKSIDRNGNETVQEYDAANRLTKTTYADTSYISNEYDGAGRMSASIDAQSNRTLYAYDAAGQQTQITDALDNITQYAYDKHGNRIQMTDAKGQVFTYEYDTEDRLVKSIFPDTTFTSAEYDARGRKVSEMDQAGVITRYGYDNAGRLTSVIDTEDNETTYTYDEQGNKLTQTDAENNTTSWTYDEIGQVLSRTLPMGQQETFTYDAVGNMFTHTDFNGQLTTYTYDTNHRVITTRYHDNTTDTFTYDDNGNRLTAINGQGTWLYDYDSQNRLIGETKPSGEILEYQYDNEGNKTQLKVIYPNTTERVEQFSYDALNRLHSVTDAELNVTTYGYDDNGNRASVSHANGTSTTYDYDNLNRLINVSHYNGVGTLINAYNYTLDDTGKRTQITESSGRVTDYTYDTLNRLYTETITDIINGDYRAEYNYDTVGNREYQTINGVQTAFSYDDNDRLTQMGGETYTYDENGSTLSKTLDSDVVTYGYNAKNKLISMTDQNTVASYVYNIDGIRTSKVENGQAINYLLDLNRDYAQVIKETTGTNEINYTYGDDLLTQESNGLTSTYLYDGLGSTRSLTNDAGIVTDGYDYEAFGETLNRTGITENNYLYAGEQFDDNLDNYYLRARYYDQNSGRFTQQDTYLGNNSDPVTLHKYLYANADPVNHIDPSGNMSIGSISAGLRVAGTLAKTAGRSLWGALRGGKKVKGKNKKEWAIYHVTAGSHLSHEFIWAKNIRTKKGFGFHVAASYRNALKSQRQGINVPGQLSLIRQDRINKAGKFTFSVKSKVLVARLGIVSFAAFKLSTVGLMSVGGSCGINYNIPSASCITWTKKAAIKAKLLSKFPF